MLGLKFIAWERRRPALITSVSVSLALINRFDLPEHFMTQDLPSTSTEPQPSAKNSASLGSLADRLKAKTQLEANAIQALTQSELAQHQQNVLALSQSALNTTRAAIDSHTSIVTSKLLGSENEIKTALSQSAAQLTTQTQEISVALDSKSSALQQTLDQSRQTLEKASSDVKTSAVKATDSVRQSLGQTTQAVETQQSELRDAMSEQTKQLMWLMKLPVLVLLTACLVICVGVWVWTDHRMQMADEYESQTAAQMKKTQQQIDFLTKQFCQTPAGKANCR